TCALARSHRSAARGAPRRVRRRRIARFRQTGIGGAFGRHSTRGREPALLRRGDHAIRQRSARHGRGGDKLYFAATARRGRLHLAVEPAAVSLHVEDRAGARRRQRRRRETLRSDAAHGHDVRRRVHRSGPACGLALVEHANIKAISFTGSTRTGAAIAAAAAPRFRKVSLEMGGKNPTLVFADWEPTEANWATLVRSAFANQGQICLCGSRILVERSIYPEFKN